MQKIPAILLIIALTLYTTVTLGGDVAAKVWAVAFACYLALVVFATLDSRNMVRLSILRLLPVALFMIYGAAVALATAILMEHASVYVALYVAVFSVALADYLGQLTVGVHIVLLMGRDYLGRPGHLSQVRR